MKKRTFTEKEILDKSRELMHAFMNRQLVPFKDILDEDFVWVGDYSSQYIQGRELFMKTVETEALLPPLQLSQEEYAVLTHERHTWVTFGRFTVTPYDTDGEQLSSKIHFTLVWKCNKDGMFLLHANACHVIDDPVPEAAPLPQARVFPEIDAEHPWGDKIDKIRIRDTNGRLHFFFPEEILYIKSCNKHCTVYTEHDSIVSRMALNEINHPHFLRIHNSYLVNIRYIRQICRYEATLTDGTQLPIGKNRYKEIQEHL